MRASTASSRLATDPLSPTLVARKWMAQSSAA